MDLNDTAVFARVVEAGSFTGAARRLDQPKSSVSRTVARLEETLGVRLLHRTTRSLSLTEAGTVFYDRVRGALQGLDDAEAAARELGLEPRGTVRLTAPPDSTSQLPEEIAKFTAKHPRIHVELSLAARFVDLVGEGFDLALRAGELRDSRLIARKVGVSRMRFVAAPSYLDAHGRPQTLVDLADHSCVLFRGHGGTARWTATPGSGRQETVEVQGAVNVDDLGFAARAAAAGMGIAMVPTMIAAHAVCRGGLEVVLQAYQSNETPINLLVPSGSFIPTRVELLRSHLTEFYQRISAEVESTCRQQSK